MNSQRSLSLLAQPFKAPLHARQRLWSPLQLPTLLQYALGKSKSEPYTAIDGTEVLTPLEPHGSLRVPRSGRCWEFDGVDDSAGCGSVATQLAGKSSWTISLFARSTSGAYTVVPAAISIGNETKTTSTIIYLFDPYGGGMGLRIYQRSSKYIDVNTETDLQVWSHYLVTSMPSGVVCYKNGNVLATHTLPFEIDPTATVFAIGSWIQQQYFGGQLRDIRVFDQSKTQQQAINLRDGLIDIDGLVASYHCNEESGAIGYDSSGNGHHLQLSGIDQASFHAVESNVPNPSNSIGCSIAVDIPAASPHDCVVFPPEAAGQTGLTVEFDLLTTDPRGVLLCFNGSSYAVAFAVDSTSATFGNSSATSLLIDGVEHLSSNRMQVQAALSTGDWVHVKIAGLDVSQWSAIRTGFAATPDYNLAGAMRNFSVSKPGDWTLRSASGNDNGFRWWGSLKSLVIPAINENTNALGGVLQYTGKSPLPIATKVPCVTLSGATNYVDIGEVASSLSGATSIRVSGKFRSNSNSLQAIYGQNTASGDNMLVVYLNATVGAGTGGIGSISVNSKFIYGLTVVGNFNDGNWHTFDLVANKSGTSTLVVDGFVATGTLVPIDPLASDSVQLGMEYDGTNPSDFFNGQLCNLRIHNGENLVASYPLQEGAGRTIYDVAGAHHGQIVGGDLAVTWGSQLVGKDHCVEHGGRIGDLGQCVPGLASSPNAADGMPKTLSPGKLGPHTLVDRNPFDAPELHGLGCDVPSLVGTDVSAIVPINTKFARSFNGDDRLFTTKLPLTGRDLARAKRHTWS
ncbi:LamG domain-containing protein [Novipirellula artificiosorum]|uniref:LamG-like jellyroll fold domain-containing protein n=1 Tax=Novipirellula artificiosorum TaxID=2528016 RepID=A0A5C6DSZ1_9BACT|nr:LamG domain-containing protein [Novipirellula artificiosorum]TWU39314.1 hypothetical protein Poly41_21380 [Novipirellula artificiosorum]